MAAQVSHSHGEQEDRPTTFTTAATITRAETLVFACHHRRARRNLLPRHTSPSRTCHHIQEPFGPSRHPHFPANPPFDDLTSDEFWWPKGKDIELSLCSVSGGETTTVQNFVDRCRSEPTPKAVDGHRESSNWWWKHKGYFSQSVDGVLSQPQIAYDTEDIGTVIPRILNTLRNGDTGCARCPHRYPNKGQQGRRKTTLTGRIGDLLAQATTNDESRASGPPP